MASSGKSLPDWLNLDLHSLSDSHRQVLYWNILFPGAGFVYAGDGLRALVFGGGAMVLLLAGMVLGLRAVTPNWTNMTRFLADVTPAAVCFLLVIVCHVLAILDSPRSRIRTRSRARVITYLVVCMLIAGAGILRFLLEIWRSAL